MGIWRTGKFILQKSPANNYTCTFTNIERNRPSLDQFDSRETMQ